MEGDLRQKLEAMKDWSGASIFTSNGDIVEQLNHELKEDEIK